MEVLTYIYTHAWPTEIYGYVELQKEFKILLCTAASSLSPFFLGCHEIRSPSDFDRRIRARNQDFTGRLPLKYLNLKECHSSIFRLLCPAKARCIGNHALSTFFNEVENIRVTHESSKEKRSLIAKRLSSGHPLPKAIWTFLQNISMAHAVIWWLHQCILPSLEKIR